MLIKEGLKQYKAEKYLHSRHRGHRWVNIHTYDDDWIICCKDTGDYNERVAPKYRNGSGKTWKYQLLPMIINRKGKWWKLYPQLKPENSIVPRLHGNERIQSGRHPNGSKVFKHQENEEVLINYQQYRETIERLLYIRIFTQPDITTAVDTLCLN